MNKILQSSVIKKLIFAIIVTMFVISLSGVIYAAPTQGTEYYFRAIKSDPDPDNTNHRYWQFEAVVERQGNLEVSTVNDVIRNNGLDPNNAFFAKISYGGSEIISTENNSNTTIYTPNISEPPAIPSLCRPGSSAYEQWLTACLTNPNTPITISFYSMDGQQRTGEIRVVPPDDSTTLLRALTGYDDAQDALNEYYSTISGDGLWAYRAKMFQDDDDYVGLFQSLNEAIGSMIFDFATTLYNMVQDGLKDAGNSTGKLITIDDLVFDRYKGISINYWEDASSNVILGKFKDAINDWFTIFRGFAIAGYLIILLYVGIRILLITSSRQQQKYKDMALSWVQGVLILFLFPICLKYVITVNHALVAQIGSGSNRNVSGSVGFTYPDGVEQDDDADLTIRAVAIPPFDKGMEEYDYMADMANQFKEGKSIPKAFVYLVMVIQFIMLLITYYKRLFMFSYLLVIFPLVALSYAIDKLGDGNAQAFQTWTKEIMLNIFMQCFHAVTYVFVMAVIFSNNGKFTKDWILAIVGVMFLFKGEEILRSILGQNSGDTVKSVRETATKAVATVAVASAITDKVAQTGSRVTGVVRAERQARADRRIARSMKGETVTTRERIANMRREAKTNKRDKEGGETRGEYYRRIYNARKGTGTAPGSVTWAQQYIDAPSQGPNISMDEPLVTDEGQEMLEAARIVSNPSAEHATPEQLRQAYDVVKKYATNSASSPQAQREVDAVMVQLGLSDDQLIQIADAQAAAAMAIMKVDVTDADKTKEVLTKVSKDLEIKLSKILFGDKAYSSTKEVTMWKRALLSDLGHISSDQIRSGLGYEGNERFIEGTSRRHKKLNEAMNPKKQAEKLQEKMESIARATNIGDGRARNIRGELMADATGRFISSGRSVYAVVTTRTGLTAKAVDTKNHLLRRFNTDQEKIDAIPDVDPRRTDARIMAPKENRDKEYQSIMAPLSDEQKEKVAEDMAVLKDFLSRTQMTDEELASSSTSEGYEVKEIQARIKSLRKAIDQNKEIETILKNEAAGMGIDDVEEAAKVLASRQFEGTPGEPLTLRSISQERARSKVIEERISDRVDAQANLESPLHDVETAMKATTTKRLVKKFRKERIETAEKYNIHMRRTVLVQTEGGISEVEGMAEAGSTIDAESVGEQRREQTQIDVRTRLQGARQTGMQGNMPPTRPQGGTTQGGPQTSSQGGVSQEGPQTGGARTDFSRPQSTADRMAQGGIQTGPSNTTQGAQQTTSQTGGPRTDFSRPQSTADRMTQGTQGSTQTGTQSGEQGSTQRGIRFSNQNTDNGTQQNSTQTENMPGGIRSMTNEGEQSRVGFETNGERQEPTAARMAREKLRTHGIDRRSTTGEGPTLMGTIMMMEETGIDVGALIDPNAPSQAKNQANAILRELGQEMAMDNRERLEAFADQILDVDKEVDKSKMEDTFNGMTAEQYEQRARSGSRKAFMDALRITTTVADTAVLAPALAGIRSGMGSEKGFAQELVEGGLAGYGAAEGINQIAYEGIGERTIKVYNPYDGSYTDIKLKRYGSVLSGQLGILDFQDGEITDLNDVRLAKIKDKVANELVNSAAENRRKARDKEAQKRANIYKEALYNNAEPKNKK